MALRASYGSVDTPPRGAVCAHAAPVAAAGARPIADGRRRSSEPPPPGPSAQNPPVAVLQTRRGLRAGARAGCHRPRGGQPGRCAAAAAAMAAADAWARAEGIEEEDEEDEALENSAAPSRGRARARTNTHLFVGALEARADEIRQR